MTITWTPVSDTTETAHVGEYFTLRAWRDSKGFGWALLADDSGLIARGQADSMESARLKAEAAAEDLQMGTLQ